MSKSETVFVIPVYQRNYDWTRANCEQLFNDIIAAGKNDKMEAHFMGSIVYITDEIYKITSSKELSIIDGQQRLTTITLIYVVLYKMLKSKAENLLSSEDRMLLKKLKKRLIDELSDDERLKLKTTGNNQEALKHILNQKDEVEFREHSRIVENFKYFKSVINQDNLAIIEKGLLKLMIVSISLERGKDNPQVIFESLNSTGLALTKGDLIRNYILMGLNPEIQQKIFEDFWQKIEECTIDKSLEIKNKNASKVSEFIRDFLTLKNNEIANEKEVYFAFKKLYPNLSSEELEELKTLMSELKSLAYFYDRLLNPEKETNLEIRLHLQFINKLKITVSYPFLMKVYQDWGQNIIDQQTFIEVLNLVQSLVIRRFIVISSNGGLNKIFASLYSKVDQENYLISIQKALCKHQGKQKFPDDDDLKKNLETKDLYNVNLSHTQYILERLENFDNKETSNITNNPEITVEHIFPQKPSPEWNRDLGSEQVKLIKENYLNTLANLTITGYNSKLSNQSFIKKRDCENGYKESRLWLNKYLSSIDKWDKAAIEKRFETLAERFLKIWQYPKVKNEETEEQKEINILEIGDLTHKKIKSATFLGQKLEAKTVNALYVEVIKQLWVLDRSSFLDEKLKDSIKLIKNPKKDDFIKEANLGDGHSFEQNVGGSNQAVKKLISVLKSFRSGTKLENELFICLRNQKEGEE